VKIVIFKAGDQGFLYVDLLAALTILSLTVTLLFSSFRSLIEIRAEEERLYQTSLEVYESILLEQIN
jgi:hypothetical protein